MYSWVSWIDAYAALKKKYILENYKVQNAFSERLEGKIILNWAGILICFSWEVFKTLVSLSSVCKRPARRIERWSIKFVLYISADSLRRLCAVQVCHSKNRIFVSG